MSPDAQTLLGIVLAVLAALIVIFVLAPGNISLERRHGRHELKMRRRGDDK